MCVFVLWWASLIVELYVYVHWYAFVMVVVDVYNYCPPSSPHKDVIRSWTVWRETSNCAWHHMLRYFMMLPTSKYISMEIRLCTKDCLSSDSTYRWQRSTNKQEMFFLLSFRVRRITIIFIFIIHWLANLIIWQENEI